MELPCSSSWSVVQLLRSAAGCSAEQQLSRSADGLARDALAAVEAIMRISPPAADSATCVEGRWRMIGVESIIKSHAVDGMAMHEWCWPISGCAAMHVPDLHNRCVQGSCRALQPHWSLKGFTLSQWLAMTSEKGTSNAWPHKHGTSTQDI